jgi:leucyl-tRNA synthetase
MAEKCAKNLSTASIEKAEKEGVDTGIRAIHPFDKNIELPVYIANFVIADYGKGALFGVPAHDERDYEFAKLYNLPIIQLSNIRMQIYQRLHIWVMAKL